MTTVRIAVAAVPGMAAWAGSVTNGLATETLCDRQPDGTQHQAMLRGVIALLDHCGGSEPVEVRTNSRHLVDGASTNLMTWVANGWRNARGEPLKNLELWQTLNDRLSVRQGRVTWTYVHAGADEGTTGLRTRAQNLCQPPPDRPNFGF